MKTTTKTHLTRYSFVALFLSSSTQKRRPRLGDEKSVARMLELLDDEKGDLSLTQWFENFVRGSGGDQTD